MRKFFVIWNLLFLSLLSALGQTERTYAIGDFYNVDGVCGIVVRVDNDGKHGLIMSLDEGKGTWSWNPNKRFDGIFNAITDATDKDDGMRNMETIARSMEQYDANWSWFPAAQWCRNKGEGWYLPSINELVDINKAYHGGKIEANKKAQKKFNATIKQNGGKPLNKNQIYYSSTEITGDQVYVIYFESGIFAYGLKGIKMYNAYFRAVRKF